MQGGEDGGGDFGVGDEGDDAEAAAAAEVCRGSRLDAAINHFLNRDAVRVVELTRPVAQRAGALLAAARMASGHAVDAFVVATALEFEQALIASADVKDLKRLAADYPQVSVVAL